MRERDANDNEVEELVRSYNQADDASRTVIEAKLADVLSPVVLRVLSRRLGLRLQDEVSFLATQAIAKTLAALKRHTKPRNLAAYAACVARGLAVNARADDRGERWNNAAACAAALQQFIHEESERRQLGTLPDGFQDLPLAERVRRLYRASLDRKYGNALCWWNRQVEALSPADPFIVKDAKSWNRAKRLFVERRIDPALWQERHHVVKEMVHPFGIRLISRCLFEAAQRREPTRAGYAIDARSSAEPDYTASWIGALSSRRERVYSHLVERLFSKPEYELELQVGRLLAAPRDQASRGQVSPYPTPMEIKRCLKRLPLNVADEILEIGFDRIAHIVERRIREYLIEPGNGQHFAAEMQQAA